MKINWFKLYTLVALPIVLFGIGYHFFNWYEIRPAEIKHDCSWTKVTENAVPAIPAITKEDVEASKISYNGCKQKYSNEWKNIGYDISDLLEATCSRRLKYESAEVPSVPEKIYYREATKDEYAFCIHEQGL